MPNNPKSHFNFSAEVARARSLGLPIVALESTVITHGLPQPDNLRLARDMEATVRREGAIPATVAVLNGTIRVGLAPAELERLADLAGKDDKLKISRRDFAAAITQEASGGTTVGGTLFAAHHSGIRAFATGGIGGVHKERRFDVSTDMQALADTPMIVVCAGAKSILDLPATLEYLETMSVPVVGYKTDRFPAFYSADSGLPVSVTLEAVEDIVRFAQTHWELMSSAVLVTQAVPPTDALDPDYINPILEQVSRELQQQGIRGQAVTPFELGRINDLTNGKSLRANLALLLNNAALAAQLAQAMVSSGRQRLA